MRSHKGYVVSSDLIIAIMVFLVLLTFAFYLNENVKDSITRGDLRENMLLHAEQASEIFLAEVSDDFVIDNALLDDFLLRNYTANKDNLALENYDYYLTINSDTYGNTSVEKEAAAYTRFSILNSTITKIRFVVWK